MRAEGLATVEQISPTLLADGREETIRMSQLGQIFTAGWKERLLLAGKLWSVTVGGIASGADVAEIIGGGGAGVIDANQAELSIGVPAGYFLIPISCRCSVHGDSGSVDGAEANLVLFADRTQTTPTDGTTITYTPLNQLDGGGAFPGFAFTTGTVDHTSPAAAVDILDYESWEAAQVSVLGTLIASLKMNYEPETPVILAGPCSVWLCFGGIADQSGIGTLVVGCVPSSYFPVV